MQTNANMRNVNTSTPYFKCNWITHLKQRKLINRIKIKEKTTQTQIALRPKYAHLTKHKL